MPGGAQPEAYVSDRPLRSDAARNRSLVLAAAEAVFSERGLDAGVDEVARRAGVGTGTLYRRWPTKDALVRELSRQLLGSVVAAARDAAAPADGHGVERFLVAVGEHLAAHSGLVRRMWDVPPDDALVTQLRADMDVLVQQGHDRGTLRADVTTEDVGLLLLAMRGLVESAAVDGEQPWRRLLELMMAALAPAPSAR